MIARNARVAVVGGGMLGLTLALRMCERGLRVSVFDGSELGGLAAGWSIETPVGPVSWDRYYHVTLASDAALRRLLADLDLDAEIAWTTTQTGYLSDGRLVPVSSPRDFLALPGLSLLAKVRLAGTIGWGSQLRNWRTLEAMPVEQWLTRWSGRATFRHFWVPLLEAKLGDAWPEANAAFIWATIQRLTAARRAGIGTEQFGAVPGGYGRVLEVLAERIAQWGGEIVTGTPVTSLAAASGGGVAVMSARCEDRFDHAIVTTTPRAAASIIDGLAADVRDRMNAVKYQGVICASVVLRSPLSPYYLTYLMDAFPFTAVVEMTAMIPPAWLGGHTLVYLPRYLAPDDPMFEATDAEISSVFLAGLRRIHPGADDDVLAVRIARSREVFPLPTLNYSTTVPPVPTGVPGISFVSSAQICNGTLNVNETVARAEDALVELGVAGPADGTP